MSDNKEDAYGDLDKFYVYRSLHSDESWKAVLVEDSVRKLPNVSFGMKIFARNEKAAIARARDLYERIHAYDSDKENVRRFAAAALKPTLTQTIVGKGPLNKVSDEEIKELSIITMKIAVALNKEYSNHFAKLKDLDESE